MATHHLKIPAPPGFDPESNAHVSAVISMVEKKRNTSGWKFINFDPDSNKIKLELRQAGSVVQSVGERKIVSLGDRFKSDGDGERAHRLFADSEDGERGYVMTEFDPYNGKAVLEKMTTAELRCREALSTALGVKPWKVRVGAHRGDAGFDVLLPDGYLGSKHDDKIVEVATSVVGKPGWYVDFNRADRQISIVPSTLPTFPPGISFPVKNITDFSTQERLLFGKSLGPNGDEEGELTYVEFSDGPHTMIQGTTQSGKAQDVYALVPTPSGFTTLLEARVGDEVLTRTGRVCTISWMSQINENPTAFRVVTSDGQSGLYDADHQWVVSDHAGRNRPRSTKRKRAALRRSSMLDATAQLRELAELRPSDEVVPMADLAETVLSVPGIPWTKEQSVYAALRFLDVESTKVSVERPRSARAAFVSRHPVPVYSVREALGHLGQGTVTATAVMDREEASASDLARMLDVDGLTPDKVRIRLRDAGIASVGTGTTSVLTPAQRAHQVTKHVSAFPARRALHALADRLTFLAGEVASLDADERIMTTGEMVAEGVLTRSSGAQFAIRVAEALNLPEAELPVSPYTFGAWLGDGSSAHGAVTSEDAEIVEQIVADGYPLRRSETKPGNASSTHFFDDLRPGLAQMLERSKTLLTRGSLDKRIPMAYLRASKDQRLALLQGLMDTDGTIDENGSCELSLSKRDLAEDALQLVRSLGIKASMSEGASSYVGRSGKRVDTEMRHRIHFTTDQPVFRLARKLCRVPVEVSENQKWLYITEIEPVDAVPMRCIQVDSEDSTYLTGEGFVTTHNTVTINALLAGAVAAGMELVIVDVPAKAVDFTWCREFVRPGGWGCETMEEGLAALNNVYREGQRRAQTLKQYDAQNIAQLPEHERRSMQRIFIVVDELAGILRKVNIPTRLDKEHPIRIKAEREAVVRDLTLMLLLRIAAEMRFVGLHLLLSTQVANVNTGVPTELRDNCSNRMLMGVSASDRVRGTSLNSPELAPEIPFNIREDGKAGRGVGVAELPGMPTRIFKGLFATTQDFAGAMQRSGVQSISLDMARPTQHDIDVALGEDGEDMKDYSGKPLKNDPDAGGMVGEDGKPLRGAAAAAAASARYNG